MVLSFQLTSVRCRDRKYLHAKLHDDHLRQLDHLTLQPYQLEYFAILRRQERPVYGLQRQYFLKLTSSWVNELFVVVSKFYAVFFLRPK